jgi:DNA (cytosine-5)-methyltransferase 1
MRLLDLFAGIGGFSLAAHWMGWDTVAFVERDKFCQKVLRKNFGQDIDIHDDITTFSGQPFRGRVDIVTGGFPCQDISIAGKHAGIEGPRSSLWYEMLRVISEVRPRFVIVENVAAFRSRGLAQVLGDFASIRFDAEWGTFCGYHVGLPMEGQRIFLVATPENDRRERRLDDSGTGYREFRYLKAVSASGDAFSDQGRFYQEVRAAEFVRTANGLPDRVDRIKSLGNSIVPQIAYEIFKAISASVDTETRPVNSCK